MKDLRDLKDLATTDYISQDFELKDFWYKRLQSETSLLAFPFFSLRLEPPAAPFQLTWVSRSQATTTPKDPTVGLCLGPYGR